MNLRELKPKLPMIIGVPILCALISVGVVLLKRKIDDTINPINSALARIEESQELLNIEFDNLAAGTAQAQSSLVSQEHLDSLLEQLAFNHAEVREALDLLNSEPIVVTRTEGTIHGDTAVIYIETLADIPRHFVFYTSDGMPVAQYTINEENGSYSLATEVFDLQVHINSIVSEASDSPTPHVITEAQISSSGDNASIRYPLDIESSVAYYALPDNSRFHWLDPQLDLAVNSEFVFGQDEQDIFSVGLGVTIMSYGTDETDYLRFIRPNINTNFEHSTLGLSLVGYNIGHVIPLIEDTWLYPNVTTRIGDWSSIGLGLTISSTL